jgi:uncharacterized protein YuzE
LKKQNFILKISTDDENVAYLQLPKHPKKLVIGIVKKTISLSEIIEGYKSIPIHLDFDEEGELIGIEIVG